MTRPDGPEHPHQGMQLSDWWPRVGAAVLDGFAIWAIAFGALIVGGIASEVAGSDEVVAPIWLLVLTVSAIAYYVGLMTRKGAHNGQTLGKQALDIRVVQDDGKPVTAGTAFVRDVLLKFVGGNLVFGIGWLIDSLWPLGERENRALHDLMVHTHVVRVRPVVRRPQIPQPQRPVAARPQLAPPIARHVDAAHRIQAGIAAAVQRAELPYVEVSTEVNSLMGLLQHSAQRAQMLYEALEETPVAGVEQRLSELGGQRPELASALQEQLTVQRRMAVQLERYDGEMERIVVELDTVRSNLISVSASGDVDNQQKLADAVRHLRDEMSAVAEGMDQAYG